VRPHGPVRPLCPVWTRSLGENFPRRLLPRHLLPRKIGTLGLIHETIRDPTLFRRWVTSRTAHSNNTPTQSCHARCHQPVMKSGLNPLRTSRARPPPCSSRCVVWDAVRPIRLWIPSLKIHIRRPAGTHVTAGNPGILQPASPALQTRLRTWLGQIAGRSGAATRSRDSLTTLTALPLH